MAKTAILMIKIISDAKQAADGFDAAGTSTSKFEANLGKAKIAAAALLTGIIALGKQAGEAASDLEQASGAVASVFKNDAPKVDALAAQAATAVGLSKTQYSNLAAVLGAQLKNLGVSQDQLIGTTDSLITRGADLAAMFGGTTADAVEALSALFRSEADPIERYGVSIKQSDVNARLASMGLNGLTGNMLRQAETQARLALLTEQTADATGQFGRETDSAAGSQQIANALWQNALADLGTGLLPLMVIGAQILQGFAQWVSQNAGAAQALAVVLAVLAVAVLAVNLAMAANPFVLVITAIAALIGLVIVLVNHFGGMEKILGDLGNWFSDTFSGIIGWLQDAVKWASDLWNGFMNLIGAGNQAQASAGQAPQAAGLSVSDNAGLSAPGVPLARMMAFSAAAAPAPRAQFAAAPAPVLPFGVSDRIGASSSVTYVTENYVTVQGAIDKNGTARTIKDVLDRKGRNDGTANGLGGGRR